MSQSPHMRLTPAPYHVPAAGAPCDLRLDGNEGLGATPALIHALGDLDPELIRRYPSIAAVEHVLCARHDVSPQHLLVTSEVKDGGWAGRVPPGGYGPPEKSTAWMEVDWVRAWKLPPAR